MSKIKVSEKFLSLQGEGKYMGVPSVFLRTFGCNFTCSGFGLAKGEVSDEPDIIAKTVDQYKTYEDLPLVNIGCDSYASWHPKFKHLSPTYNTDELAESLVDLLPQKEWAGEHLVITGGEPLLGWQRAYPALLDHPKMQELKEITFETNGTQKLTKEFKQYLLNWSLNPRNNRNKHDSITFSVSAKLSCSGEKAEDAIQPAIVVEYESVGYTYLKFVVATQEDAEEALATTKIYRDLGFKGPVYLMPEGGTEASQNMNAKTVADFALANGMRYSARLQVHLYGNEWGT